MAEWPWVCGKWPSLCFVHSVRVSYMVCSLSPPRRSLCWFTQSSCPDPIDMINTYTTGYHTTSHCMHIDTYHICTCIHMRHIACAIAHVHTYTHTSCGTCIYTHMHTQYKGYPPYYAHKHYNTCTLILRATHTG